MKNINIKSLLIGVLATVLLFACADADKTSPSIVSEAEAALGAKKKTYAFKIEFFDDGTAESQMNSLGNLGWTVVGSRRAKSARTDSFGYECILQREK